MFRKAGTRLIIAVAFCIIGQLWCLSSVMAQGNLIIMPRRVTFEGTKRTQELNVANTGKDTAKYLISVLQYRMLENGNFQEISTPDSGQNFADKNFRFFPRSVVLAPNESQTIKVQVINASELKAGEYRSHLYFRAVPNEKPAEVKSDAKFAKTMTVHLVPTFGIAIPVIIRVGAAKATVSLNTPEFEIGDDGIPKVRLIFARSGNASVYGDLQVNHISEQGKMTQVGIAKGFAIYTPNTGRTFTFNLDKSANVNYHKGKLQIVYATSSDKKPVIITESTINLL
ncbi:molecular chaperone [Pedobacter steynii]|uniref:Uncharacterized protein n=1 Tax=Pedobacter steynii TaxID=430522 RepID=A0A1D7QLY5_9SPHI|nr:fimbria/pilus periplasmic chaperone [Pedobacter steynii]AOM79681.1 hypothetical protein BFS30_22490 [Pedobacter steynii]